MNGFIADLRKEFTGYGKNSFLKDLMAGLTVCAVALPLALAFGVSSGATAASGLITAVIAGIAISLFSGAYYQISGPTGAMAVILISIIAQYQLDGVFVATLIAGILLLLAGLFRMGKLAAFIPLPVIAGFTSGIATVIALGQVDNLFGTHSEGESILHKLLSYGDLGFSPNYYALAIGLFVVLFMIFYPKKWNAVVPGSLLSIIAATIVTVLLHLNVPIVGNIPTTLLPDERLNILSIDWGTVPNLLAPAVSIAILGMIESLMCGVSAGKMTGVGLNTNRELAAQGIGNILVPFFGGIPATAAIARTSVAIKSGAKTRLTGILHAVGLLASMFLLAPVMSQIPLSALAGVLIVTAWRMNDWEFIHYIFNKKFKGAILKFSVTMLATVFFDLTIAILIGVGVSLILLISKLSKLDINFDKVDMSRIGHHDPDLHEKYANAMVAYISGPIIFANTSTIDQIPSNINGCDFLLLSMRGVSMLDITGAQALIDLIEKMGKADIKLVMCGVPDKTMDMIRRSGIDTLLGEKNFFWSVERALLHSAE